MGGDIGFTIGLVILASIVWGILFAMHFNQKKSNAKK